MALVKLHLITEGEENHNEWLVGVVKTSLSYSHSWSAVPLSIARRRATDLKCWSAISTLGAYLQNGLEG